MMSYRLLAIVFWLLHWLPFPLLRVKGAVLGELLFLILKRRRNIGLRNLELCFPEWSAQQRCRILRRHFRELSSIFLGYGILLYASPARLKKLIRQEGLEHFEAAAQQGPVVILLPHFLALDYAGVRHAIDHQGASMYSEQRMGAVDQLFYRARTRFNNPQLIKRSEGIRSCVRSLKNGYDFVYLPDQDLGPRESIFVPFFGIPTATIPALGRLVQLSGARVIPMIPELSWRGITAHYFPVWENFPAGDLIEDTSRMNEFIAEQIRKYPSQYYWLHRRFKTRPEGEGSLY